jgi:hypothetical protein
MKGEKRWLKEDMMYLWVSEFFAFLRDLGKNCARNISSSGKRSLSHGKNNIYSIHLLFFSFSLSTGYFVYARTDYLHAAKRLSDLKKHKTRFSIAKTTTRSKKLFLNATFVHFSLLSQRAALKRSTNR